jgi:hypothetical protein
MDIDGAPPQPDTDADDTELRRPSMRRSGGQTYISGIVAWPLSKADRNNRKLGWEEDEWVALSSRNGGATKYPLRLEHDRAKVCGEVLETTVSYIPSARRNALYAMARIDDSTPLGREVIQGIASGQLKGFSYGFGAKVIPGSSRYLNYMREISITASPHKVESGFIVQANQSGGSAGDDNNDDEYAAENYEDYCALVPTPLQKQQPEPQPQPTAAVDQMDKTQPSPAQPAPAMDTDQQQQQPKAAPAAPAPQQQQQQQPAADAPLDLDALATELVALRKANAEAQARAAASEAQIQSYERSARLERLKAAATEFEKVKPALKASGMTDEEMAEWFQDNADKPSGRKAMAAWASEQERKAKDEERSTRQAKAEKAQIEARARELLLGSSASRAKTQTDTHAATSSAKRPAPSTIDPMVLEVLGLDKFDAAAQSSKAQQTAAAARSRQQQSAMRDDDAASAAEEEAPEYTPPAHPGARALYAMKRIIEAPGQIDVRCSRSDYTTAIDAADKLGVACDARLVDAFVRVDPEVTRLAHSRAFQEHRYDGYDLIPRTEYFHIA